MKEKYFTFENIDNESELLFSQLQLCRTEKDIPFSPKNSALLILDMQKFFLDQSSHAYIPSSDAVIPKIQQLLNLYTNAGLPVIATRHLNTTSDAGLMKSWWRDIIFEDNAMSEIIPEVAALDANIINKTQYDAFYKTDLEDYLNKQGITQIVITGVMTHLCCETTARSAFVRGFEVFCPVDATATYNFEFHRSTFINLSHGFAVPVLTNDIKNKMGEVQSCSSIK